MEPVKGKKYVQKREPVTVVYVRHMAGGQGWPPYTDVFIRSSSGSERYVPLHEFNLDYEPFDGV